MSYQDLKMLQILVHMLLGQQHCKQLEQNIFYHFFMHENRFPSFHSKTPTHCNSYIKVHCRQYFQDYDLRHIGCQKL